MIQLAEQNSNRREAAAVRRLAGPAIRWQHGDVEEGAVAPDLARDLQPDAPAGG
jgi:hypothetical protein